MFELDQFLGPLMSQKKGITAKPIKYVVINSLNLLTRFSDITGNLFLLRGIAHKI